MNARMGIVNNKLRPRCNFFLEWVFSGTLIRRTQVVDSFNHRTESWPLFLLLKKNRKQNFYISVSMWTPHNLVFHFILLLVNSLISFSVFFFFFCLYRSVWTCCLLVIRTWCSCVLCTGTNCFLQLAIVS